MLAEHSHDVPSGRARTSSRCGQPAEDGGSRREEQMTRLRFPSVMRWPRQVLVLFILVVVVPLNASSVA